MGIEPTWPAWKAGALPLSYTRDAPNPNRDAHAVNGTSRALAFHARQSRLPAHRRRHVSVAAGLNSR